MPKRTDEELRAAFDALPEKGKHYINLLKDELLDVRARLAHLEERAANETEQP